MHLKRSSGPTTAATPPGGLQRHPTGCGPAWAVQTAVVGTHGLSAANLNGVNGLAVRFAAVTADRIALAANLNGVNGLAVRFAAVTADRIALAANLNGVNGLAVRFAAVTADRIALAANLNGVNGLAVRFAAVTADRIALAANLNGVNGLAVRFAAVTADRIALAANLNGVRLGVHHRSLASTSAYMTSSASRSALWAICTRAASTSSDVVGSVLSPLSSSTPSKFCLIV